MQRKGVDDASQRLGGSLRSTVDTLKEIDIKVPGASFYRPGFGIRLGVLKADALPRLDPVRLEPNTWGTGLSTLIPSAARDKLRLREDAAIVNNYRMVEEDYSCRICIFLLPPTLIGVSLVYVSTTKDALT